MLYENLEIRAGLFVEASPSQLQDELDANVWHNDKRTMLEQGKGRTYSTITLVICQKKRKGVYCGVWRDRYMEEKQNTPNNVGQPSECWWTKRAIHERGWTFGKGAASHRSHLPLPPFHPYGGVRCWSCPSLPNLELLTTHLLLLSLSLSLPLIVSQPHPLGPVTTLQWRRSTPFLVHPANVTFPPRSTHVSLYPKNPKTRGFIPALVDLTILLRRGWF